MKVSSLIFVCGGCASAVSTTVSTFSEVPTMCTPDFMPANLAVAQDATGATLADLGLSVQRPRDMFRLSRVRRLEGPCATKIGAFVLDNLYVSEQLALGYEIANGPQILRRNVSIDNQYTGKNEPHPRLRGAEFVMAYVMGYSRSDGVLRSHHIGLWRGSRGDLVRAYSQIGGEFVFLGEVLRSSRPLRSVTYFPAPDTPSGRLGLTQVAEDGTLRLIELNWSHPHLY